LESVEVERDGSSQKDVQILEGDRGDMCFVQRGQQLGRG